MPASDSLTIKVDRQIPDHGLLRRIDQGSYGEVWLAKSVVGTLRAVKIISRSNFADHRPYEREFAGIQKFEPISRTHPGLVAILHIGRNEEAEYFYYVMELADDLTGGQRINPETYTARTLSNEKNRRGRIPPAECVQIGLSLSSALAHLHRHGLIHRDIKPSNIIFVGGKPKFADIGLVTQISDEASFVGTPGFVAPEGPGRPTADIYSLGMVLYELAMGQSAKEFPALPTQIDDRIASPGLWLLNEIILKACERDLPMRFQSAEEMHVALAELAAKPSFQEETAGLEIVSESRVLAPSRNSFTRSARTLPEKSVAVLPFLNMSSDQENEFLSDGITEDLITALSKIPGLRVPARTSSFAFKGKNEDIRLIGEKLTVKTLLEGSVRKSGRRLRISTQLVNVSDGSHLWSEKYDRELEDVFAIQDEITRAIVSALKVQLAGETEAPLVKKQTESTSAYEHYLKGRALWYQRGVGMRKALHHFELALLEDSKYALAYVGLADAHHLLGFYGYASPLEYVPKLRAAVGKALTLEPLLPEAHLAFAVLNHWYELEFELAEREYHRAMELNPNYALAHNWYASFLITQKRFEEAIDEANCAVSLDPLSPYFRAVLGWHLYLSDQHRAAVDQLRETLELAPDYALAHWILGQALAAFGRTQEAIASLERADQLADGAAWVHGSLAHAYGVFGQKEKATALLMELQDAEKQPRVRPFVLALVHAGLGHDDVAFQYLWKAYDEQDMWLVWVEFNHAFDHLHSDRRFAELIAKIGLARKSK